MPKISESMIEECRKRFEEGDANALLDAIDFCARSATALPLWAVDGWCQRYAKWRSYQAKTLDEAFSVQRPKGVRIRDREHRQYLMPRVVLEVWRLRQREKLPIDEALFERVGETLNISMGTARDIYYDKTNFWRDVIENIRPPV